MGQDRRTPAMQLGLAKGKVRVYLAAPNLVYSDWKDLVESHAALLDALRTRDPEQARDAMAKHIDQSLNLFVARPLSTTDK